MDLDDELGADDPATAPGLPDDDGLPTAGDDLGITPSTPVAVDHDPAQANTGGDQIGGTDASNLPLAKDVPDDLLADANEPDADTRDEDGEEVVVEVPAEAAPVPIPGTDYVEAPGFPPPATPSSTSDQAQARVLFEQQINREAELFANGAREAFINAKLAGHTITVVVDDGEDDDAAPSEDSELTVGPNDAQTDAVADYEPVDYPHINQ